MAFTLSPEAAKVLAKANWPECETLPGMRRLPKDEWLIERADADGYPCDGGERILVSAHGFLPPGCTEESGWWVSFALSDLPNDLVSADDLKRFGITAKTERRTFLYRLARSLHAPLSKLATAMSEREKRQWAAFNSKSAV